MTCSGTQRRSPFRIIVAIGSTVGFLSPWISHFDELCSGSINSPQDCESVSIGETSFRVFMLIVARTLLRRGTHHVAFLYVLINHFPDIIGILARKRFGIGWSTSK